MPGEETSSQLDPTEIESDAGPELTSSRLLDSITDPCLVTDLALTCVPLRFSGRLVP